jgi:hypothetical protein
MGECQDIVYLGNGFVFEILAKYKTGKPYNLNFKFNWVPRDEILPTLLRNMHPSGTMAEKFLFQGPRFSTSLQSEEEMN